MHPKTNCFCSYCRRAATTGATTPTTAPTALRSTASPSAIASTNAIVERLKRGQPGTGRPDDAPSLDTSIREQRQRAGELHQRTRGESLDDYGARIRKTVDAAIVEVTR